MSSTKRFLNVIKSVGINQNERAMNMALFFGEIMEINPLKIKVDNRFIIDEDFLILTSAVKKKTIDLKHFHNYTDVNDLGSTLNKQTNNSLINPIEITKALEVGEKVILLRVQGGQQFVVIDRL